MNLSETIAGYQSNRSPLLIILTDLTFCRKSSINISIHYWYYNRFIHNRTINGTEPWILVRMHMANERYQLNSHSTSDRLDSQASRDNREICIELVFKSLDCFTVCVCVWGGGGGVSTQLQCIYYLVPYTESRPLRVFRLFKHRSCCDFWLRIHQFHSYLSGLFHWYWGNHTIASVTMKQPW